MEEPSAMNKYIGSSVSLGRANDSGKINYRKSTAHNMSVDQAS